MGGARRFGSSRARSLYAGDADQYREHQLLQHRPGPDHAYLGGINFINLSARYARTQYQTSPFNSNRALGSIAVGHDMSAGSTVSLNGDFERVMFENTMVNTDFNRSSGYARYELHGARTDFVGDFGATTISQRGSSTTGALAKMELSRKLSAAAKVTVTAGQELTDAGDSFSKLQGGAIGPHQHRNGGADLCKLHKRFRLGHLAICPQSYDVQIEREMGEGYLSKSTLVRCHHAERRVQRGQTIDARVQRGAHWPFVQDRLHQCSGRNRNREFKL